MAVAGSDAADCCKQGNSCSRDEWTGLWNGNIVRDGKTADAAKFSDKILALRQVYGVTYFWFSSSCGSSSPNSQSAFLMSLKYGNVNCTPRKGNKPDYALCE